MIEYHEMLQWADPEAYEAYQATQAEKVPEDH